MRNIFVIVVALSLVGLVSCENRQGVEESQVDVREAIFQKAKGGKYYGGTFIYTEDYIPEDLFPHDVKDVITYRIATQVFDGLVRFNPATLDIEPALAKNWEVSEDRKIYTFHLRTDAKFQKIGRRITAEDVAYCLKLLATKHPNNSLFSSTIKDVIKGATAYYEGQAQDVEGIKIVDDSTIVIELEHPYQLFLQILAGPAGFVFPKEAVAQGEDGYYLKEIIGSGPFIVEQISDSEVILIKNPDYYLTDDVGNKLPFLDRVVIKRQKDRDIVINEFLAGKVDMVYRLSTDEIISILESSPSKDLKYVDQRSPEMSTQMYVLNTASPPFNDEAFRKALSYMIDREDIYNRVLMGEAQSPARFGIVPPVFPEYHNNELQGYSYNEEEARKWLEQAQNKPDTIELMINEGDPIHMHVALAVYEYLKKFGLHLNIDVVSRQQWLDRLQHGQFQMARLAWIADFPHPASFLSIFYGVGVPDDPTAPSFPNVSRFKNSTFDENYINGLYAPDKETAYRYLLEAEKVVINKVPAIFLWYEENYRILQPYVKDMFKNPMEYRDFRFVYFDKTAYEKAQELYRKKAEMHES